MSFINDIAFDERVDELEVEGHLRVGGDILLHGEFPKMDQKIASLNSSISLKANQSDLDVAVVTLNMKADHEEVVASLSLKADQSELDSALSSVDKSHRRRGWLARDQGKSECFGYFGSSGECFGRRSDE